MAGGGIRLDGVKWLACTWQVLASPNSGFNGTRLRAETVALLFLCLNHPPIHSVILYVHIKECKLPFTD